MANATAAREWRTSDTDELAQKIPGWGSDLDPKNRPGVPKEKVPEKGTGANWIEPERQIPKIKIHKSVEHRDLTAVFGTSCPPKGLSGVIRDFAYRLSEGRIPHWLLLLFADRVDVAESRIMGLLKGNPDNPIQEAGLGAELKRHGVRSRLFQQRADVSRLQKEVLLMAGVATAVWSALRYFKRRIRLQS